MSGKFRKLLDKIPTWTLSGLTIILILWLTLVPHPTGDLDLPLFPGFDKIAHGIMFGFLSFVVLLEWMKKRGWQPISMAGLALVPFGSALFGILIEWLQHLMGLGRTLEIYDMLADAAGAMIGGALWAVIQNSIRDPQ